MIATDLQKNTHADVTYQYFIDISQTVLYNFSNPEEYQALEPIRCYALTLVSMFRSRSTKS
jgi:hypothetical protein